MTDSTEVPGPDTTADGRRRVELQALLAERVPHELAKAEWSRERLCALRDERLRALVRHAKEHSPWHRKRLAGVDPETLSGDDLSAIRPMSKQDLMRNWDEIVTDPTVRLADAWAHLDRVGTDGPGFLHGKHVVVATGGTTGSRGVVAWDGEAFVEGILANLRHAAWQERRLGGSIQRLAMVSAHNPVHGSAMSGWLLPSQRFDARPFPPLLPIPELVRGLNDYQPNALSGFSSILVLLAMEAIAGHLRLDLLAIQADSEPLAPHERELLERAFNAPVVHAYGTTETGPIGVSSPPHAELHMFEDIAVYEAVAADHSPVPDGIESHALLVTNVVNTLLPLIRYEITDRVTMATGPNPGPFGGKRIARILGRSGEPLVYPNGTTVHPYAFNDILIDTPGLLQYQTQQTPDGLDLFLIEAEGMDRDRLASRLTTMLRELGLVEPKVRLHPVERLERHPETGKLNTHKPT